MIANQLFLCLESNKCKKKNKKLILKNVFLYLILNEFLETIMIIKRINEAKQKNKKNKAKKKNLWDGPLRMDLEWNGADINPFSVTKENAPKLESGKRLRREQTPTSIHNRVQTTFNPDQEVKPNEISHKAGLSSSLSFSFALVLHLELSYFFSAFHRLILMNKTFFLFFSVLVDKYFIGWLFTFYCLL